MTPLRIIGTGSKPKLPKVFKRKWVAALRSGEFKQGRGGLHVSISSSYCCLGVGCAVLGASLESLQRCGTITYLALIDPDRVPDKIKDALFAHDGNATAEARLISMNDSDDWSFHEIADWIEEHL